MRSRKVQAQQADRGGAFPMSSNASRTSKSSAKSRASSTASSYYRHYNDDDIPRPMCGQAALNKILSPVTKTTLSAANKGTTNDRSLLASSLVGDGKSQYEPMPFDVTPMDNIYSSDRSKCSETLQDEPQETTIFIPQFNVNKAKQVQAKKQPKIPSMRTRLASVAEASREDSTEQGTLEEVDSSGSFLTSGEDAKPEKIPPVRARTPPARNIPPPRERMSSKDRRIEQMIRSMQEIIMQQEENISSLGSQNAQYRENMTLFQDHVMNLKKEQLNQRNEISKLAFERETYEAEAISLREELKTMRSELVRAKSERGTTWSPKTASASLTMNEASIGRKAQSPVSPERKVAPWTNIKAVSPRQKVAPWATTSDSSAEKDSTKAKHSPKHDAHSNHPSSPKRQSVSFHDHNDVLAEHVQQRDDAGTAFDMRWERSRQRSVFNKSNSTRDTNHSIARATLLQVETSLQETREPSPRHSPGPKTSSLSSSPKLHPTSGKCSDLQELQARANELRDTVARMKLDSPTKPTDRMRLSSPKSPKDAGSSNTSSPASYDERKRDAVLRYSRGERGTSYWNSHDMSTHAEEREA